MDRYNASLKTAFDESRPSGGRDSSNAMGRERLLGDGVREVRGLLHESEGAVVQDRSHGVCADAACCAGGSARRNARRLGPALAATGVDDQHTEKGEAGSAIRIGVTRFVEHDVVLLEVDRTIENSAADLQWAGARGRQLHGPGRDRGDLAARSGDGPTTGGGGGGRGCRRRCCRRRGRAPPPPATATAGAAAAGEAGGSGDRYETEQAGGERHD